MDQNVDKFYQATMKFGKNALQNQEAVLEAVMPHLEILSHWSSLHCEILERNKEKKHLGFPFLARSAQLHLCQSAVIRLSANQLSADPSVHPSIISQTGIIKLDNLINKIKT